MKFILEIDIPEHEIEEYGTDFVLRDYLHKVADKIENGHCEPDSGVVRDENGVQRGAWTVGA